MIIAIIQARMGSVRLPNKVMKKVCDKPLIGCLLARVSKSKFIEKLILATSVSVNNDSLVTYVESLGFDVFRGSEQDVLKRFYLASQKYKASTVIRITGDCPFVDPNLIDSLIEEYFKSGADYASNTLPPTYPDGLDVEVFSFSSLKRAHENAIILSDREHVTQYIRNSGQFRIYNKFNEIDFSNSRWTLDEIDDFEVVSNVFEYFFPDVFFSWEDILRLEVECPDLFLKNKHIRRNEGAILTDQEKLKKR